MQGADNTSAGGKSGTPAGLMAEEALTGLANVSSKDIVAKYRRDPKDVGSPEVQIALLTSRLEKLSMHFRKHVMDRHSQRGMLRLIAQRKALLQYLKTESSERYKSLINALGLRK